MEKGIDAVLDREMPEVPEGVEPVIPQPLVPVDVVAASQAASEQPLGDELPSSSSSSTEISPATTPATMVSTTEPEQPVLVSPPQQPQQPPQPQTDGRASLRLSGTVTFVQPLPNAPPFKEPTSSAQSSGTPSSNGTPASASPGLREESSRSPKQQLLPPLPQIPQQQQPLQSPPQEQHHVTRTSSDNSITVTTAKPGSIPGSPLMPKPTSSMSSLPDALPRRKSVTMSLGTVIAPKDALQRKQPVSVAQTNNSANEGIKLNADDLAELEEDAQRERLINDMEAAKDMKKAMARQLPASMIRAASTTSSPNVLVPSPAASAQETTSPVAPRSSPQRTEPDPTSPVIAATGSPSKNTITEPVAAATPVSVSQPSKTASEPQPLQPLGFR